MDAIRLTILFLLFAGLVGLWYWSKRKAKLSGSVRNAGGFKITQKRWLDQKTGVAMVESEGQTFLLAYTVGGGVSWQPLAPKPADPFDVDADAEPMGRFDEMLAEAGLQ